MIFLFFFRRLVLYSTPAVRNLCDEISVGALIKWKAKSRAAKKKNFRVKAKAERKKSAHNSITKIDYDEINQGQSEEVEVARWRRYVTVKQAWVAFAPCFSRTKGENVHGWARGFISFSLSFPLFFLEAV